MRPSTVPKSNGNGNGHAEDDRPQSRPPAVDRVEDGRKKRRPDELARAARDSHQHGKGNALISSLYSTSNSLQRPSILNTVKRPRDAEEKTTKKTKRVEHIPSPAAKKTADADSLRSLLETRNQLHSPPLRKGYPGGGSTTTTPTLPWISSDPLVSRAAEDEDAMDVTTSGTPNKMLTASSYEEAMEEDTCSPFYFIDKVREQSGEQGNEETESKEFIYLNVVQSSEKALFNPYNLKIVPHHQVNPSDYFTMSSKGVTHIIHSEADFTPLKQWEREHSIFHNIFKIPFFRKFRRWKTFYFWKKYIRKTTIDKYKDFLEDNLFILRKDLCPNLIKVRQLCLTIQSLPMYRVNHETQVLEKYCTLQQVQRDRAWKELNKITAQITGLVSEACKASMKAHTDVDKVRELAETDSMDDTEMLARASSGMAHSGINGSKSKNKRKEANAVQLLNVNVSDQPYRQSYTELSQKRAECRRLTNYIRLADYMVIDSIVVLCMKSVTEIRTVMQYRKPPTAAELLLLREQKEKEAEEQRALEQKMGKRGMAAKKPEKKERGPDDGSDSDGDEDDDHVPAPVFQAEVIFKDDALVVTPGKESFDFKVEAVIQGFIDTIVRVERFLQMEEFKAYTEPVLADHGDDADFGVGPDVAAMVTSEGEFKAMSLALKESLGNAFHDVESYMAEYENFKKMYLENRRMDTVKIKQEDPPLDWFKDTMDMYKKQHEEVSKIKTKKKVGLYYVSTKKLKEFLLPSPVNCLDEIQNLQPVIAREKNRILLDELSEAVKLLNTSPADVEEFVKYLDFHTKITARMDSLEAEFENVKEMYNLLYVENITVVQEDEMAYSTGTVPQIQKLRTAIQVAEDNKDAQIRKFSDEIDNKYEKLVADLNDISSRSMDPMIEDVNSEMQTVIDYVAGLQTEIAAVQDAEKKYADYQEMFGVEITKVEDIYDISMDVGNKVKLWTSLRDWQVLAAEWNVTTFNQINPEELSNEVNRYNKTVNQVTRGLPDNPVCHKLKAMVEEFKLTLPVIQCLRNDTLQKHHFAQIDEIVGRELSKEPDYTLGLLMELKVMDLKEEIQAVSNMATQEAALEELLAKVQRTWTGGGEAVSVEFVVNPYKEQKDVYALGAVDDIITQIEDSGVIISTIISSRFCTGGLKIRVEKWEEDIKYMNDTLDKWLEFQRNWMYLESIFGSAEIARQWPQDAKTFSGVDKQWKELMKRVFENPSVYRIMISNLNVGEKFDQNNKQLERILNNLEKKLEEKRRYFPRFYFLSNDDLLDILSQIKNPALIQPHLLKMFDNIKSLEFGSNGTDIVALISGEGENVPLAKHPKARGEVEKWLLFLEQYMVLSLRRLAKVCVTDYDTRPRKEWIFEHPCQLVLTVNQVVWCREVEQGLREEDGKAGLQKFQQKSYSNLGELADLTGLDLKRIQRGLLTTLITCEVHNRDLVDDMVNEGVCRVTEFGWQKQLRSEWDPNEGAVAGEQGAVVLKQNNSQFTYGYEYQGCQPRLVCTPLTDRIYMTVTGALRLCLGAAPSGPAGTGKTETVKDMAKCLAFQCIVYNCSDGVTYKMMEKFFSGLAQTGAWCCLDEFNRINIEVLSVIASQLAEVRQALLAKVEKFTFQGTPDVDIKPNFGTFITMNPGYAGRTELPDNLKVLFRPVAVMTPDFRMIAEVILFSEGFKDAKTLSLKITQLFKLSSEQLSPQDHYDFGMRALKSILVMAGGLKRGSPHLTEDVTLIRACRDANIPKFVADDIPLFNGIMADLFPGIELPAHDYGELQEAFTHMVESNTYQHVDTFNLKIIQFYETLVVRHGVMLVGETGSGKTVNREVMKGALTWLREERDSTNQFAQVVQLHSMNPKSITYGELYGEVNAFTAEWKDGVCAIIAKQCVADTTPDQKWILFDGPVDTLWIESMNSVLDDSKLLCLDNGVRIKLPDTVRMLFEVQDLSVASPATTSRCGMVFMNPSELGWYAPVVTWSLTGLKPFVTETGREFLLSLFSAYVQKGLDFVYKQCKQMIASVAINLVQSLCDMFLALIKTQNVDLINEEQAIVEEIIKIMFAFCFVWSIGGNVNQASQEKFDGYARDLLESVTMFPAFGLVYDFHIDFTTRKFITWETIVPDFKYDSKQPFFQIIVPTIDTVRYSFMIKTLLQVNKPVLLSGVSGVGKSVVMSDTLTKNVEGLALHVISIQFSAQTTSTRTQEMLEAKLKAKRKNLLGAPPNKNVVLFIDDLNMPAVEEFGAQPPIELIRQMMGMGGFYDRKQLFWKFVQDVTLVAACGPPEGGRSPTTPRLVRFFHLMYIPELAEDTLRKIFVSILGGFMEPFTADVRGLVKPMVQSSVEIYLRIKDEMRPRPSKAHYTFNLRDLSKVFQGIMQVGPRTCGNVATASHLWIHENMRCFHDRLVDAEDRRFFTEDMMMDVLKRNFSSNSTHEEIFEKQTILFGDFLKFGCPPEQKVYEEVNDPRRLQRLFDEYLDEYNLSTSKQMSLVFFKDHCEHLCRIIRILRQPRGNALLVGLAGSGKQSLTRLAAAIQEYKSFQIEVTKSYSIDSFRADLLELYNVAGVENTPIVFLFADNQIMDETMLEDVNGMLNTGEVPSLFGPEEKEKTINACTEAARQVGQADTRDQVYQFFINRVRDNLHIVLCMSPVGDNFRRWCRQFPSLVNCCAIDWFDKWPAEALQSVAERLLTDCDYGVVPDGFGKAVVETCVDIHMIVGEKSVKFYEELRRYFYVTPTSYLEFVSLFLALLDEKRTESTNAINRIKNGKKKMKETTAEVDVMQAELTKMQPLLQESRSKTEAMMADLAVRQEAATKIQNEASAIAEEASEQQAVAAALQKDAQKDLDEALPELENSLKALESLNKQDIGEIRGYGSAPKAVDKTMQAVLIILREPKTDWDYAKQVLGNGNFLQRLKDYDKDNIPASVITKLQKFINDPDFTPDKVAAGGSAACKSLCMWVRAMDLYYRVSRAVAPKKAALESAQAKLDEMTAKMDSANKKLKAVEDELQQLQAMLDKSVKEKEDLEYNIDLSSKRLVAANALTGSLATEVVRWDALVEQMEKDMLTLAGDVFLSAACVAYLGAFTAPYRIAMAEQWIEICKERGMIISDSFSLVNTLATAMQMREWAIMTLPTDNISLENAVKVTVCTSDKSRRWPLMIDPQGQAHKWVSRMEAKKGLKVIKLTDPGYVRVLESAIRNGNPILVEDVGETLDPSLEPVLLKQVYEASGRMLINLGSNQVDYDPNFRFYMTSKIANPKYLPDMCIKVTLINFTVTTQGLEEQMLGDVVSIEMAETEETKNKIIQSVASDKKKLKQYEDGILEDLEKAEGNILDNQKVIESLKKAQTTSELLSKRLKEAEAQSADIEKQRLRYVPVAKRASLLYFVIADLALIDPMYQYSLDYFKKLFRQVVEAAPSHEDFEEHLDVLRNLVTDAVYVNICRGLFKKDKFILGFLISIQILRGAGKITEGEWQYFLRSLNMIKSEDEDSNPLDWLESRKWALICALERTCKGFQGLCADMKERPTTWRDWIETEDYHNEVPLPGPDLSGPPDQHCAGCDTSEVSDILSSVGCPANPSAPELKAALRKLNVEGKFDDATKVATTLFGNEQKFGTQWQGLSNFQRCLLIKALRLPHLIFALTEYVKCDLGPRFIDPPPFDLKGSTADANSTTPIIFILSPGADPFALLLKFAEEKGYSERLHVVSLGQGQGENAKRMIEHGKKSGDWVILQNCHLSKSFMPELEKQIASFSNNLVSINESFRLWLTSMPSSFFPIPILQNSIKLTNENPTGLRANLFRCYNDIKSLDVFEQGAKDFPECSKENAYHKLLYGTAFFHSVIQERKKFGPLGWNVRYEFNDTDLEVGTQWLQMFLAEQEEIPWEALKYVIGQIVYGGRVTDPWDRRALLSILVKFMHPGMLQDNFSMSQTGLYNVPPLGTLDSYRTYLSQMPHHDDPDIFGMHTNANITFQLEECDAILTTVLSIQPRAAAGSSDGPSPDEIVMAKAVEIESICPAILNIQEEAGPHTFRVMPNGLPYSLSTVLSHEIVKFNKLLNVMKSSLAEFQKALKGLVIMSEQLEQVYVCFLDGKVPLLWEKKAYPSLKPLSSWCKDLIERVDFIRKWLKKGEPPAFWMSGLFYPHGFMTGTLQAYARQYGTSVDVLGISFTILEESVEEIHESPEAGVLVYGLFMDSFRWNPEEKKCEDSLPGEQFAQLPVVHFLPAVHHKKPADKYAAPLYKTTTRKGNISSLGQSTNFILAVEVPMAFDEEYWTQKGAALVCALND